MSSCGVGVFRETDCHLPNDFAYTFLIHLKVFFFSRSVCEIFIILSTNWAHASHCASTYDAQRNAHKLQSVDWNSFRISILWVSRAACTNMFSSPTQRACLRSLMQFIDELPFLTHCLVLGTRPLAHVMNIIIIQNAISLRRRRILTTKTDRRRGIEGESSSSKNRKPIWFQFFRWETFF